MDGLTCKRCGKTKSSIEMSKRSTTICKSCWAEYMRDWYARQTEERKRVWRDRVARYRSENPTQVLATRLSTHFRNPTKTSARRCVEAAVHAGNIDKPHRCGSCGKEVGFMKNGRVNIHAHHHDHINEPLEISWLCPSCHYRADKILREARRSV